jgi:hypothetical protein
MYKIDKSVNFNPLVGNEVTQVRIGISEVILRFVNDGLSITILSQYNLGENKSILFNTIANNPDQSKNLVCLLGKTIESINVVESNILAINFSGNYYLELIDDSEEYESFTINSKTFELIV